MKKHELNALRARIRELAEMGRALNPRIQASSREDRARLRAEKYSIGHEARKLLVAYALLRGRPIAEMERGRHACVYRFPYAQSSLAEVVRVLHEYAPKSEYASWTRQKVYDESIAWLPAIPPPPKRRFIGPIRRASAEEWQSARAFRKLRQMPWCMACDSMALFLPAKPAHSCGRRAA